MTKSTQILPKECKIDVTHRVPLEPQLAPDEGTAVKEAQRCLGNHFCQSCDLCRITCPELCITRNAGNGRIEIDLEFCKGCGICAFICPKNAIKMERDKNI
jgi:2-oxoacid:acceptor oxidoreductase delta subunit (pyruvate/2-ketoisovalerate family)